MKEIIRSAHVLRTATSKMNQGQQLYSKGQGLYTKEKMDNHLAVDNLIRDAVVDNRVRPSILLPAVNVLSSLMAVTVSALDPASSAAIQRGVNEATRDKVNDCIREVLESEGVDGGQGQAVKEVLKLIRNDAEDQFVSIKAQSPSPLTPCQQLLCDVSKQCTKILFAVSRQL